MINILIGAAIGAAVNAGAYCFIQAWKGQPIQMKSLAGAVAGGIVAGALAGTTFGASLLGGTTTAAAEFLAIDGAAASGAEKMTENALDGKALGDGVPEAAAWGAITAPATGLVLRGVQTEIGNMVREAAVLQAGTDVASTAAGAAAKRLPIAHHMTAPTTHATGTLVAHAMFGSPWVGEAVKTVKTIRSSNPTPTSPSGATLTTTADSTAGLPAPPRPAKISKPAVQPAPFANPAAAAGMIRGTPSPSATRGINTALDLGDDN